MRAGEIVDTVEQRLRCEHRRRLTVYRREWSIGVGSSRIDVAAINGRITGCEIKSARDDFARLARQVEIYSAVLDVAILVVEGDRAVGRATAVLPDWWGIWQTTSRAPMPAVTVVRSASDNPDVQPLAVAQLLWRDEARTVLTRRGSARGLRSSTRWRLWEALAEQLPLDVLRREVRAAIRARPGW